MTALSDGLLILKDNWLMVLVILLLILTGQLVISVAMKWIFDHSLTTEEYYSLGMSGWMLPASLLSLLWYLWKPADLPQINIGAFVVLLFILSGLLLLRVKKQIIENPKIVLICLLFLFCISVPLRLAFISRVLMPQYFDSVRHYTIINSLLRTGAASVTASSQWLGINYYHVGFHFLAAFLVSITHAEITNAMLILGQVIVAAIPLSVFFMIKHKTTSNKAGVFAVLLAGVGWSMPAYAVNWGKYPAVASLPLIQFVLSLMYLTVRERKALPIAKKWVLYILLISSILLSIFFHSRSLVVIAIAIVASMGARVWRNLPRLPRFIVLGLLILGILWEIIFIQRQEILEPLFNPYGQKGFLITLLILFLAIFAQKMYPELTFSSIFGIFLLLAGLFIPTPKLIPRFADLTILDRTFVEIILYLPFSILGGLGLAGLEQTWRGASIRPAKFPGWQDRAVGIFFMGLIIGNALMRYEYYPSDCCTLVGQDDLTAIVWIEKNLPPDARILISADESIVQASGTLQGYAAADAGAWINALTGRTTIPWLYGTNLGKETKFKSLCKMGIHYIYIGAIGRSFHAPRLRAHPAWYRPLLSLSRTEVYQVIGCR